jgi:hypothetical protein
MFLGPIVKKLGLSNLTTGFDSAIPYIIGTIGTIVWGHVTDRTDERRCELFLRLTVRHGGAVTGGTHPRNVGVRRSSSIHHKTVTKLPRTLATRGRKRRSWGAS